MMHAVQATVVPGSRSCSRRGDANPFIEGMHKRLRHWCIPHVERDSNRPFRDGEQSRRSRSRIKDLAFPESSLAAWRPRGAMPGGFRERVQRRLHDARQRRRVKPDSPPQGGAIAHDRGISLTQPHAAA